MKTSLLEMIRKTVAKSNSKEKARKHYHIRLIFDQNKHQLGLFITSSLLFILLQKGYQNTPLFSGADVYSVLRELRRAPGCCYIILYRWSRKHGISVVKRCVEGFEFSLVLNICNFE